MKTKLTLLLSLFLLLGCTKKKQPEAEKTYRFNSTINIDGRARTYFLNLPPNYYDTDGFSLVSPTDFSWDFFYQYSLP